MLVRKTVNLGEEEFGEEEGSGCPVLMDPVEDRNEGVYDFENDKR